MSHASDREQPTGPHPALAGVWPDFTAPSKFAAPDPRWEDPGLPDFRLIWRLAREVGYSVGLHGSMIRDVDLIAVPWTDEAVSAEDFIAHMLVGLDAHLIGDADVRKPHGRKAWAIQIRDAYKKHMDVSVMPRGQLSGKAGELGSDWRHPMHWSAVPGGFSLTAGGQTVTAPLTREQMVKMAFDVLAAAMAMDCLPEAEGNG